MSGKPVTSQNVPSIDNFRAYSPHTAGDSRPQPDTPIGLEESWRNANSCARWVVPFACAVAYDDPATGRPKAAVMVMAVVTRCRIHRKAPSVSVADWSRLP